MFQSGKVKLSGGTVNDLTPDTILYGKGFNITNIDYNNITTNALVFEHPLSIVNRYVTEGEPTTSNYVSIDLSNYYNSNIINSILFLKQDKLKPVKPIIIDNSNNISIDLSATGWTSNLTTNVVYSTSIDSKFGIGTSIPLSKLHIANDNLTISKYNNNFNIGYDTQLDFILSTCNNTISKQFYINNSAPNNSLYIDNYGSVIINYEKNTYDNSYKLNVNGAINALSYSSNGTLLDFSKYALKTELINIDFENIAIKCIGSNIKNIDYNNININRPIFDPLAFNNNYNNISINKSYLGWINNSNNSVVSVLQSNIGIGTSIPLGKLHIGSTNTREDGNIIISKTELDSITNLVNYNYNFKIGYDVNNNFTLGSYVKNTSYIWKKHITIANNTIENALVITSSNIGIGNTSPIGILHIGSTNNTSDGNIIISKTTGNTNTNFKIAYDNFNNFSFGSFANNIWIKQLSIHNKSPSNSLYINSNGFIGIGNSTPIGLFHIGSTIDNSDGNIIISKTYNNINSNIKFGYDDKNNITIGSFNINGNGWNKQLVINNNAPSYSLSIDSNANVGIGTFEPLATLHLGSINNICDSTIIISKTTSSNLNMKIGYDSNNNFTLGSYSTNKIWNKQILINNDALEYSLVIDSNGNIGIGKINDINYKLDISGSLKTIDCLIENNLNVNNIINNNDISTNNLNVFNNINCANDINFKNAYCTNINNKNELISKSINVDDININSNVNASNINTNYLNVLSNIISYNHVTENSTINSNLRTSNIITQNLNSTSNILTSNIRSSNGIINELQVNNIRVNNSINSSNLTTTNINNTNRINTSAIFTSNIYSTTIGINNNNPIGHLHVGNSNLNRNINLLLLEATNNIYKIGYDTNNNFIIGDFTSNIWNKQFYINKNASSNSLVIDSNGNVGINTSIINYNLDINGSTNSRSLFKNGDVVLSSNEINSSISTALIPYITSNDANVRFPTNTYLSSTLTTLQNDISLKISKAFTIDANVYAAESRFPPVPYDEGSYTTTGINTINYFGIGECYKCSFTASGTDIGDGQYNIYTSSAFRNNARNVSNLFDYTLTTANKPYYFKDNLYRISTVNSISTNVYIGNSYISDSKYKGDFIVVEFPKPILLTKFRFYINTSSPTNNIFKAPSKWKCYGSNDAITFTYIIAASSFINILTENNYKFYDVNTDSGTNTIRYYEMIINTINVIPYKYIAFVISKLVGNEATALVLSRLELYGRELLQPIFVSSNVLNNYLLNYITREDLLATSNYLLNYLTVVSPLVKTGNTISINLESALFADSTNESILGISNLIAQYINDRINTDKWVQTSANNLYYNNGLVCIGSNYFDPQYLFSVNGNVKVANINCSIVNSTTLKGDGSLITNINYNNLMNLPNLNNIGSWIYKNSNVYSLLTANVGIGYSSTSTLDNNKLKVNGNIFSSGNVIATNLLEGTTKLSDKYLQIDTASSLYLLKSGDRISTLGINTDPPTLTDSYSLNVNGSIYSANTINAASNIQENGENLSSRYLSITTADNNYLRLGGGSIYALAIGGPYNINSVNKLYVYGSIYSTTNINAVSNIQENGENLSSKYLTIINASNNYLPFLGGNITSNLTINSNVSIGTNVISDSYSLFVNGSIYSSSNINAISNIQENGENLSSKYLTIINASNNYLPFSGGNITSNLTINSNVSIGTNVISDSYSLFVNGSIYSSNDLYENCEKLTDKYLSINNASNIYLLNIGGNINGSLNISKFLNVSSNITCGSNITCSSNIYTSNLETSNINNYGSLNTNGNVNINGGIINQVASGIGISNVFNANMIINNNLNVNSNIICGSTITCSSNIYTSNLETSNINNYGSLNTTGNVNINGGVINQVVGSSGISNVFNANMIINNNLNVNSNITCGSNITCSSNIYTSNLETFNINNYGSLNTNENVNINGGVINQVASGIGISNVFNANMIINNNLNVNSNITCGSNITCSSNIYTSNLETSNINNYGSLNTNGNVNINGGVINQVAGSSGISNVFNANTIINNNLNVNSNITCGSNITCSSNIYTSNLESSNINSFNIICNSIQTCNLKTLLPIETCNINNYGLINSTGDIYIGGNILQSGNQTNHFTGNINIGTITDKNNILFVGGSINCSSNINANSNIYTSNLETSNINNNGSLNTSSLIINGTISQPVNADIYLSGNIGIGITSSVFYKLFVNGDICCLDNIITYGNFQENGVNISNKYLGISTASNTYLPLIGGIITSNLTINSNVGIGTTPSALYSLNVNGDINSYKNIYTSSNFIENGVKLEDKYLTLSGGIITSNLTINSNLGIGTTPSTLYSLNVNGSIYTSSNFIENGVKLEDKYLTLSGGIITSNLTINSNLGIGTTPSTLYSLNANGSIYTSSNFIENGVKLEDKYLTLSGGIITSNLTINSNLGIGTTPSALYSLNANGSIYTSSNFIENGVKLEDKYLTLSGGIITSNLTINSNLGIGTTPSSLYSLNVNGSIYTSSNFIENGVKLEDKYLTLSGGIIPSNLTINSNLGIGTTPSALYSLNANGDINSYKNIYTSSNFIENGVKLEDKYLTLSGGIITSNLTINSNLGIGTTPSSLYSLNANGSIYTSSNFIENGVKLEDKYLNIIDASNIYFPIANFTNEVLNNQHNLQKKYGIKVVCSTIVILNNVTYYKHDINLLTYTRLRDDNTSGSSYRVFSLKCFSTTGIFNSMILNKTPSILQYDIYMSNYNASISVCAIGFPNNYYLNKITSGDIFILRTNNFNYISILAKTINTTVCCIISDFLF